MIVAIIQPEKLDDVKESLFAAEIHKMTVSRVKGCGQQGGYTEHYRGQMRTVNLLNKVKLEIAVNDDFVKPTVKAIIKGAKSECLKGSTGGEKVITHLIVPMLRFEHDDVFLLSQNQ